METQKFSADNAGLGRALAFLDEVCPNPRVSVIFDEIGSNIVRCSGATAFDISVDRTSEGVVIVVSDDGKEFDPTKFDHPDISLPAEQREIGGLGIMMVRKMSKSFTYERTGDGRNVVRIVV